MRVEWRRIAATSNSTEVRTENKASSRRFAFSLCAWEQSTMMNGKFSVGVDVGAQHQVRNHGRERQNPAAAEDENRAERGSDLIVGSIIEGIDAILHRASLRIQDI